MVKGETVQERARYTWSTADELSFIATMAQGSKPGVRAEALRGYIESLKLRKVWTGLNQSEIETSAWEALAREKVAR